MSDNQGPTGHQPEGQPQQPGPPPYGQPGQQWQGQPHPAQGQPTYGEPGPQQPYGQPGPQGQQWQGQPGQGAPGQPGKGGVNKGLLFGILALVILVIGGIIAAVILLGGDDKDDEKSGGGGPEDTSETLSPVETVEALVQASEDGDCPGVQELMVDGETFPCDDLLGNAEGYELKSAAEKSVDGDKAVVTTEYVQGGSTGTEEFPLTRVDGVWLVDLGEEASGSDSSADGGSDTEVPSATGAHPLMLMDEFTAAIKANDCDAAKELLLDPEAADCNEITTDDAEQVEFGSAQLVTDGADASTVSSEMTAGGSTVGTFTVDFVLDDDGAWKIESWSY